MIYLSGESIPSELTHDAILLAPEHVSRSGVCRCPLYLQSWVLNAWLGKIQRIVTCPADKVRDFLSRRIVVFLHYTKGIAYIPSCLCVGCLNMIQARKLQPANPTLKFPNLSVPAPCWTGWYNSRCSITRKCSKCRPRPGDCSILFVFSNESTDWC